MQDNTIGVVGSGNMGTQIALLFANNGFSVKIWNHKLHPEFSSNFTRLAKIQSRLGFIDKKQITTIVESVEYSDDMALVANCDFVIEAVTEDKSIKSLVLRKLDELAVDNKVIASNTSTLSITELASFTRNPERFLGVHFFNPPMSMKLVEVIKGELTSEDSLTLALDILGCINKHPVVLPETPGFVVNRLLFPMINEAIFLFSEGVSDAKTIDSCMQMGANHPMGPLELADLIGLDICLSILTTLVEETGDGKYRPAPLLKRYVRAGKLGKKTGTGFYSYRKRNKL